MSSVVGYSTCPVNFAAATMRPFLSRPLGLARFEAPPRSAPQGRPYPVRSRYAVATVCDASNEA